MTLHELSMVILRRWYVVLATIALASGLGYLFARDGGLYSTSTVVTLELPDAGPWESGGSSEGGVITFAAAVATQINGGVAPIGYASADAPLYGAGVRQGVRVGLPDTGGQWGVAYRRAAIEIDVVAPDRAWVVENQERKLEEVLRTAEAFQVGIPEKSRIAVAVEPLSTLIERIAPTRLSQLLAAAALAIAAMLVGAWLAVVVDRRTYARRQSFQPAGSRKTSEGAAS